MKAHLIYCHPSKQSYTFEILTHLKQTLSKNDIQFTVTDLYQMDFKSDMSEQEYRREGFANFDLPIPEDVKQEHQKIKAADGLIFLYPIWWSDCPAKLKGWFDRVYSVGFLYGKDKADNPITALNPLDFGLAICTAGYANEDLEKMGIAESMRKVMVNDRLGDRFRHKELVILGGTLDKEKVKTLHIERVSKVVNQISIIIKKL